MKAQSYIPGFDELSSGGFPRRRSYILEGETGTGKSIFGIQFLYYGALEQGEKGLYISTNDFAESIRENCLVFGWDLRKLEDDNKLFIMDARRIGKNIDSEVLGEEKVDLLLEISRICRQNSVKRIVFDSLSGDCYDIILKLKNLILEREITALFIYGKGEKIGDGVIEFSKKGEEREILIKKMCGVKHSLKKHKMKITNSGISVSEK